MYMDKVNTEENILVSIIMSVYNTKKEFLVEAIESVLRQTYKKIEFIIIDDNSDVQTKKILQYYSEDIRVKLYTNEENKGLTQNLNYALSISNGVYIARMDADDICEHDRIAKQVLFLNNHPQIGIISTRFNIYDGIKKGKHKFEAIYPDQVKANLFFGNNNVMHSSVMFRSSIINIVNGLCYDENIKKSQDFDMWVRASRLTQIEVMPDYLMTYRVSDNQISAIRSKEQAKYRTQILVKQIEELGIAPSIQQIELHVAFVSGKKVSSIEQLKKWVFLLTKKNREMQLFDNRIFIYYLSIRAVKSGIKSIHNLKDVIYMIPLIGFALITRVLTVGKVRV